MIVPSILNDHILKDINPAVEIPVLITPTVLISNDFDDKEVYLVMTPFSIFLYEIKDEIITLFDKQYFYDILNVKTSKKRYRIKFGTKSLTFIGNQAETIARMAICQIKSIFLPDEVNAFTECLLPSESYYPSIRTRFIAHALSKGTLPPKEDLNLIIEKLYSISSHFDLEDCPCLNDVIDGALFALYPIDIIHHITIPFIKNSEFWTIMKNYINYNTNIEWITFSNDPEPNNKFKQMCQVIKDGANKHLKIMEFKNALFSEKTLNSLLLALSTNFVDTVIFNHCGFDMSEDMLTIMLGSLKTRTKLTCVGFLTWNFERREKIFESFNSINKLCIRGTDVDLATLLSNASKFGCATLDFSSNNSIDEIGGDLVFSPSLNHLYLNNIKWRADNLLKIISIASKMNNTIELQLANAKIDETELKHFDNGMSTLQCGKIEAFTWNCNILTPNITKFILSGAIKFLSLAGCELKGHERFLEELKCQYLDIHGTDKKLGSSLPYVIKLLSKSSVVFINAAHNDLGVSNLEKLAIAIENHESIRCLNIDDNRLDKLLSIKEFGLRMYNKKRLHIYFPWLDVYKTCKSTYVSTVLEVQNCFHIPKKKLTGSISADAWQNSIDGFYPEDKVAELVVRTQPIECPNSDYFNDKEEEEEENPDDDENFCEEAIDTIWNMEVINPPSNTIEAIAKNIAKKYSLETLVNNIVK